MTLHKVCKFKNQGGQVFIIVALSILALIGAIGLAVDSGLGYMIKARLNTALDAASIAAANAVSQGTTEGAQTASAQAAARKFFAVNYPADYLGSTVTFNELNDHNFHVGFDQGKVTIDVQASAAVPVTLMRTMGFNLLTVAAATQTVRKDLDMAFVIDASGSMLASGPRVKVETKSFLSRFDQLHDRMALIHFSVGAEVDDAIWPAGCNDPCRGFKPANLNNHIDSINFAGWTNSAEGFWNARDQLNSVAPAKRSTLRVIVFFSDGAPNTLSSQIKFKSGSDCNYPKTSPGKGFRVPGSIISDDTATGSVLGLGRIDVQMDWLSNRFSDPTCTFPLPLGILPAGALPLNQETTSVVAADALPKFYNAHPVLATNVNIDEFHLSDSGPRPADATPTYANINRVSRNLVEAMANKARSEGIYVLTLGLGAQLTTASGPDGEHGDVVLKCMANSSDAQPSCQKANQPVGIYCYAVDTNALKPCFEKLASFILRISK